MPEKVSSWEDYQAGYRQAVCDLIPDPNKQHGSNGSIYLAYFLGIVLGAILYKYTKE